MSKKKPNSKSARLHFSKRATAPKTERWHYSQVLPDKITIFKKPIERVARSEQEIKEIVKNTVWHEIAHHFGMSESRVRQAEARRREFSKI